MQLETFAGLTQFHGTIRGRTYGELSCVLIVPNVGDMHWVLWRRNGRFSRRTDQVVHKAGEATFLFQLVCFAGLIAVTLARTPCARVAGARIEVLHPPTCCY